MGNNQEWVAVSLALGAEARVWMEQVFPREFEVNLELVKRRPTALDPLASQPQFVVSWRDGPIADGWRLTDPVLSIHYRGQDSPWLPAAALMTWVMIEWPEAFRRQP